MKEKLENWIKNRTWEDYALIGIVVVSLIIAGIYVAPLKYTLGPMYGGDTFYHMGISLHLERGGGFLANPQLLGEYSWNPYLYHVMTNIVGMTFNIPFEKANLYMIFVSIILSSVIGYALGIALFKRKDIALFIVSFLCIYSFSAFYYKNFAFVVMYPLFALLLYLAVTKRTWLTYLLAGLTLGAIGLTHMLGFVAFVIFTIIVLTYYYVARFLHKEDGKYHFKKDMFRKQFSEDYWKIVMFTIIAVGIALIFWFKPIFVFHLHTVNNIAAYDSIDLKENYFSYAFSTIKNLFWVNSDFSIGGIVNNLTSLLALTFIILYFFNKHKSDASKYIMLMLLTTIILYLHYLITIPIAGIEFFGESMGPHVYIVFHTLAACMGIIFIAGFFKNEKLKKWIAVIMVSALVILTIVGVKGMFNSTYYKSAVQYDIPPYVKDVSTWLRTNTNVNDVILSTNEISFMVSSVSGDKVVTTRRAHSGMFVDVDRRWADAAVIMYGNNSVLRKQLLEKYQIKYVYWQYNWVTLDYTYDDKGNLVNIFDPLLIIYTPEYEEYFKDNGVKYIRMNMWLDPAFRSDDYKKYDSLLVIPYNNSDSNPWNPQFTSMLKLDKSFYQEGAEAARIYTIQ